MGYGTACGCFLPPHDSRTAIKSENAISAPHRAPSLGFRKHACHREHVLILTALITRITELFDKMNAETADGPVFNGQGSVNPWVCERIEGGGVIHNSRSDNTIVAFYTYDESVVRCVVVSVNDYVGGNFLQGNLKGNTILIGRVCVPAKTVH